ncbi:T-cell surface glycoprotein CD3 zeta chain-like [Cheilinus undulatus]|uniref:T-cell surface glycoprotein CD3 zeta chain-like n=1 Tax=Cheilinus undulatus TaxID=241271 RepID=UPI001BD5456A|nr:T-cell surface glycoprotein CD3 zeta chain-like [Cheilinus undulatus]
MEVGPLSEPILCYILDGFLIVYCTIATALYFREKFSSLPYMLIEAPEENGRIYQELERPRDADPYQMLEPSKRKKRAAKKKKPKPRPAEENGQDTYESLVTQDPAPPLPPQ